MNTTTTQSSPSPQHPTDLIPLIAAQRAAAAKSEAEQPQRRVLVIGKSGHGKTFSVATTAPKVIVIDYDNQLNDPIVRQRVAGIYPMWDKDWVRFELKGIANQPIANLRNLLCSKPIQAMDHTYTLLIDSMNQWADEADAELMDACPKGASGEKDTYWYWAQWANTLRDFHVQIKKLRCNVVVTGIEEEIREAQSGQVEGVRFNLPGKKFSHRIFSFYTDVFRQIKQVTQKPDKTVDISYVWQVQPDREFPLAKTRIKTNKLYVPSTWESFK